MADSNESKLFLDGKPVEGFVESHEHISPVSMYLKILAALFEIVTTCRHLHHAKDRLRKALK